MLLYLKLVQHDDSVPSGHLQCTRLVSYSTMTFASVSCSFQTHLRVIPGRARPRLINHPRIVPPIHLPTPFIRPVLPVHLARLVNCILIQELLAK
jgi:hypothetical protein